MIITNQPELAEKCYAVVNRGMGRDGQLNRFGIIGDNYQMSELAAAILIPQLHTFGDLCRKREQIMAQLDGRIGSIPGLRPFTQFPKTAIRAQMRYSFFYEKALSYGASTADFIRRAKEADLPLMGGHRAVATDNALFDHFASATDFPIAQKLQDAIVAIHHTEILRGVEYWEEALERIQELV
jgi:dTDP-4-amino-4,6-dideoxygalactose transaminase